MFEKPKKHKKKFGLVKNFLSFYKSWDTKRPEIGILTLQTPVEVLWKLALRYNQNYSARAYFIQLDRLSSFIQTKLTKLDLTHLV